MLSVCLNLGDISKVVKIELKQISDLLPNEVGCGVNGVRKHALLTGVCVTTDPPPRAMLSTSGILKLVVTPPI